MRLIDADAFIKDLGLSNGGEGEYVTLEDFDMQKTAYDVDRVVCQMESEAKRWQESGEEYEDQKELGVAEGYRLAIEIVKAGGANGQGITDSF